MSKTITVKSSKELVAAAKKAGAGDTILLASGHYGDVVLTAIRPTGQVTIKSADPDNDAVFESLKVTRCSNFLFDDIDIRNPLKPGEKEWTVAATINLSDNISLVGIDFQGSINGNRNDDGNGLTVTYSSQITVLDSSFQEFNNAVVLGTVTDMVFAGNTVREVREGVNMSGINGGLFERNYMTDIVPDTSKGDHSDAFQVHSAGSKLGSNDLIFRSNVIIADSQGIFVKSELAAQGVTHSNMREGDGPGLAPAIIVGGLTNAVVSGNIAPLFLTRTDWISNNLVWGNNIDVMDSAQRKGVSVESVFAAPLAVGDIDFSSLDARGANGVDVTNIGFRSVADIGHLSGNTAAMLAAYVPHFDQNFANVHLV